MPERHLTIATACLLDEAGRLLLVRKRATRTFILPGGKLEPSESLREALMRELNEELGPDLGTTGLELLGNFQARAANEPDHRVEAAVSVGHLRGTPVVRAEIEELDWLEGGFPDRDNLAPLLREQVLPALRDWCQRNR
ncbi:NUDIX domain-containing protein [Pseudomonas sp.]|uniref:NUDIX hydrolase n=1 Tax=Pseudomonas sp. TaxID=306 RepID=UPI0028B04853|nr:NUDIX domain-containing protein [Pseudomonas sp.]